MQTNSCDRCGPDVGPYAETHALIAALNGDDDHLADLINDSTAFELRTFVDAMEGVTDVIGDRLGHGGP
jgi:hypothetical protein